MALPFDCRLGSCVACAARVGPDDLEKIDNSEQVRIEAVSNLPNLIHKYTTHLETFYFVLNLLTPPPRIDAVLPERRAPKGRLHPFLRSLSSR